MLRGVVLKHWYINCSSHGLYLCLHDFWRKLEHATINHIQHWQEGMIWLVCWDEQKFSASCPRLLRKTKEKKSLHFRLMSTKEWRWWLELSLQQLTIVTALWQQHSSSISISSSSSNDAHDKYSGKRRETSHLLFLGVILVVNYPWLTRSAPMILKKKKKKKKRQCCLPTPSTALSYTTTAARVPLSRAAAR